MIYKLELLARFIKHRIDFAKISILGGVIYEQCTMVRASREDTGDPEAVIFI